MRAHLQVDDCRHHLPAHHTVHTLQRARGSAVPCARHAQRRFVRFFVAAAQLRCDDYDFGGKELNAVLPAPSYCLPRCTVHRWCWLSLPCDKRQEQLNS
jgi:hypothetical protein